MKSITARQTEVLKIIGRLIKKQGYPPTVKEIGVAIGVSTNGAHEHLLALKKAGRVDWTKHVHRTLRIL